MERHTTGLTKQRTATSRESKGDRSGSHFHVSTAKLPDPQKIKEFLNKMKAKTQLQAIHQSFGHQPITTITTEQAEDDQELIQLRNTLGPKTPTTKSKPNLSQQFSKFKFAKPLKATGAPVQTEGAQSSSKGFLGKVNDWIEKLETSQPKKRGHSSVHSRNISSSSQTLTKTSERMHPLAASTSHIKTLFSKPSEHKRDLSQSSTRLKPPHPKPGSLFTQGQVNPRFEEQQGFMTEGTSHKNFPSSHRSSYANLGLGAGNLSGMTRDDIIVENELIRQKIAQLQRNLAKEALQRRFWQEKYQDLESKYNERIMNKVRNSTPGPLRGSSVEHKSHHFVDDVKISLPTRATGDSSRKSR